MTPEEAKRRNRERLEAKMVKLGGNDKRTEELIQTIQSLTQTFGDNNVQGALEAVQVAVGQVAEAVARPIEIEQLTRLSDAFTDVSQAIESIDQNITVEAPKVDVKAPDVKVDMKPVTDGLAKISLLLVC